MAFKYIENKDIQRNFVNGISEVEVLPGNFKGHHHYKLNLQAGATYQPAEKYSDKTVIYIFGIHNGVLRKSARLWLRKSNHHGAYRYWYYSASGCYHKP